VIAATNDAASRPRSERVTAAVLAGGRGERIGEAKANVRLAGSTLAERAVASLRQAGLDPFIVTKRDRPVEIEGVEVVVEPDRPRHPLAGIAAAIRKAGERQVIVLACDLPLLTPDFFAWLADHDGGTVIPCPGGEPQPLAGRYGPADLEAIESALERQAPAREAAAGLAATFAGDGELARFGDPAVMFTNVNTPEDLRRAEALLRRD
jgi:molybdopterin-guanine dinucleotide biosynthesis protein A